MHRLQRRWTGWRVVLVAGCLMLAIGCAVAAGAVDTRPAPPPAQPFDTAMAATPVACASELYAYIKVAEAARDLSADRSILTFALDDLQANLADCLKEDGETERRDAIADGMAPPGALLREI